MSSATGYVYLDASDGRALMTVFQMIVKHVMNIHMNRPNQNADENGDAVGEIDIDKMKRYISYCKA